MKCKECGNENPVKACYCRTCGAAFSEKERKEAYDATIYGKIDNALEAKSWISLDKITSHPAVRIAVIALLAFLTFLNISKNGNKLMIQNSESYDLAYRQEADEYYVLTDSKEVTLSVYIPQKTEKIMLSEYKEKTLLSENEVNKEDGIKVNQTQDSYYIITAYYDKGKTEDILFFVCPKEAVNE